jgi:hypothetical protein
MATLTFDAAISHAIHMSAPPLSPERAVEDGGASHDWHVGTRNGEADRPSPPQCRNITEAEAVEHVEHRRTAMTAEVEANERSTRGEDAPPMVVSALKRKYQY